MKYNTVSPVRTQIPEQYQGKKQAEGQYLFHNLLRYWLGWMMSSSSFEV